jgi:hypothetical protein
MANILDNPHGGVLHTFNALTQLMNACKAVMVAHYEQFRLLGSENGCEMRSKYDTTPPSERIPNPHVSNGILGHIKSTTSDGSAGGGAHQYNSRVEILSNPITRSQYIRNLSIAFERCRTGGASYASKIEDEASNPVILSE